MNSNISHFAPALWTIPETDPQTLALLVNAEAELKDRLQQINHQHSNIKFANSLAVEDMIIVDQIAQMDADIEIFVLDTGRLNTETTLFMQTAEQYYPDVHFVVYRPDAAAVVNYTQQFGEFAFYQGIEQRKQCCFIRKVAPLNTALVDADAWITGQRREQSPTRSALLFSEHDGIRNIAKYNPLFDWSEDLVWAYIQQHQVPFNPLYRQGYPSIGCEPCTRPVRKNEDIRAGRWWWEQKDGKECGLHVSS